MSDVRSLPSRPNIEHLKNEAKALLKGFVDAESDAVARFARHPRARDETKQSMKLADAQHVLALEHGYETWRELRDYVESDIVVVDDIVERRDTGALDILLNNDPSWRSRRARWRGARREQDLLTHVASQGHLDLVDVLLDHGVQSQVDVPAVFFWCLRRGQFAVADHLFERCDVEIHHLEEHLYQLTEDLDVEGVAWLLKKGANPDYRRAGIRWTPLHNALHTYPTLWKERQQICQLLVDAGADHDDNAVYDLLTGRTESLLARIDADSSILQQPFDLRGGRDIEIERRGDYGGAPISNTSLLHHCAEYGLLDEARLLLEHGADPNQRAQPGEDGFDTHTPLFNTLTTNANACWDLLNLLLEAGADVNATADIRIGETEMRQVTPLQYIERFPNKYWKDNGTHTWGSMPSLDTDPHPAVVDLLYSHGAR